MVTLNINVLESAKSQGISSKDLTHLASELRLILDVFNFNDAIWDESHRTKKQEKISRGHAKTDNVELF